MEEKVKEMDHQNRKDEIVVSVVVPVYKVEAYLESCVKSLFEQNGKAGSMEILLIDDGSPDRCGEICDQLAEAHEEIRVFHKKNGGLSSTRNRGIREARGKYIVFVDSDDTLEAGTLGKIQEALEKYGEVDSVFYDGLEDDGTDNDSLRRITDDHVSVFENGKDFLLKKYRDNNLNVEAWLYAYRRAFLEESQLTFEEGILHEDVEFTPRALMKCGKIIQLPDQLYHYMVRENSISTQKNKEKNIRDLFGTLRKLDQMADEQDSELRKWMKNGILDSYLNMVQTARMYQKQYRKLLDKRFLLGKAATNWNRFRVLVCLINVRLYCFMNDCYKKL